MKRIDYDRPLQTWNGRYEINVLRHLSDHRVLCLLENDDENDVFAVTLDECGHIVEGPDEIRSRADEYRAVYSPTFRPFEPHEIDNSVIGRIVIERVTGARDMITGVEGAQIKVDGCLYPPKIAFGKFYNETGEQPFGKLETHADDE